MVFLKQISNVCLFLKKMFKAQMIGNSENESKFQFKTKKCIRIWIAEFLMILFDKKNNYWNVCVFGIFKSLKIYVECKNFKIEKLYDEHERKYAKKMKSNVQLSGHSTE